MFAVAERPTGRIAQVRPHLRVVDLPRLGSRRRRRNGETHNDQSDLAHDFPPQMSDIVDRLHCTVISCRHPPADRPDGCPGGGVSRGRWSRQSCSIPIERSEQGQPDNTQGIPFSAQSFCPGKRMPDLGETTRGTLSPLERYGAVSRGWFLRIVCWRPAGWLPWSFKSNVSASY